MRAVIILFAMFFALPASAQDDAHYLNGTFSVQGISLLPTMTINRVIASDGNFYKIALTAKPGVKDFVKKVIISLFLLFDKKIIIVHYTGTSITKY